MKKFGLILMVLVLSFGVVFAGGKKETTTVKSTLPTVRLVTDATGIDDKSFNAAA